MSSDNSGVIEELELTMGMALPSLSFKAGIGVWMLAMLANVLDDGRCVSMDWRCKRLDIRGTSRNMYVSVSFKNGMIESHHGRKLVCPSLAWWGKSDVGGGYPARAMA